MDLSGRRKARLLDRLLEKNVSLDSISPLESYKKKKNGANKMAKKINSKTKGKVGEREFSKFLRDHGIEARRGQQFRGSPESPDVITSLDNRFHFEVKRVERLNVPKAYQQAANDSGEHQRPVVAHRRNREPWLVTISGETFCELLEGFLEQNPEQECD